MDQVQPTDIAELFSLAIFYAGFQSRGPSLGTMKRSRAKLIPSPEASDRKLLRLGTSKIGGPFFDMKPGFLGPIYPFFNGPGRLRSICWKDSKFRVLLADSQSFQLCIRNRARGPFDAISYWWRSYHVNGFLQVRKPQNAFCIDLENPNSLIDIELAHLK